MKTRILMVGLAAVALVMTLAVRASRQINEANQARAALASQSETLRITIALFEQRLQAAKHGLAQTALPTTLMPDQRGLSATIATSTGATTKSSATAGRLSPETIIANDPQKLAAYSKSFHDSLDLIHGGMFKALHLSPGQMEKFKDLQVWLEQRWMDIKAAVETQGLDQQGDAYWGLQAEHRKIRRAKEAELFGEGPLWEQYQEYYRTQYLRNAVQRIASTEAYPDAPITSAQVERVAEILDRNGGRDPTQSWKEQHWSTIDWEAAGAQLQGVLSASQLATLRLFIRPWAAQVAITKRTNELVAEAKRISRQPGN